jgi:hypothetical protein
MSKRIIVFLVFIITLTSCNEPDKSGEVKADTNSDAFIPLENKQDEINHKVNIQDSILILSKQIIQLIKYKKWEEISFFIHPEKGISFFPYGNISIQGSRNCKSEELKNFMIDTTLYHWGTYDGSGEEILLTNSQYYKKFIYDVDFYKSPNVAVDTVLGSGNSVININKVFPQSHFVEFHFPGFDKQYGGMDWRSLRLIYEIKDNHIYLIAISHDQWTS